MKVFVTGGSGYIGRATIDVLVRRGTEVSALARSDDSAQTVAAAGAKPVRGELNDTAVLYEAARAAHGVIHLAQHRGPDAGEVDQKAAEALQDGAGPGPYVHTGGVWVYGDTCGVVDEDAPMAPPRLTAWRLASERCVLARAATGERPIVVRPGLVYGNGGGLVDSFYAEPGRVSGAVPCIGDGSNHWSLVHVDDLAELYALALSAPPGSVYLGVADTNPTAGQVAQALSRAIGHPGSVRYLSEAQAQSQMGPISEAFLLDQQLTGTKARRELGWQPTHTDPLGELSRP
ncbi:NAD-dependent epimerase/dehydratase family protein [Streptomyces sp. NBC_00996]|uniref:NAD-dependent epimerase/dehydratase family protein n=1 Tax=Streptomyces sp. NBC_00996 TaxID=2903710 RepID=UPI00386D0E11|nr:NAD-dependent epimerase/dehydratase family protein [Streptomyces sp. NBC_00996]